MSLICIGYLYLSAKGIDALFGTPLPTVTHYQEEAFLIVTAIIALLELLYFQRSKARNKVRQERRDKQFNELLEVRNKLRRKAHTYSDHADKLKLFISDRLLEYIEYDEKFLHFKNIAAEVRHNGIVCYDQVMTALKTAAEQQQDGEQQRYRSALSSMEYLWDLLDLSTTDNIAMYIANKNYECEEHYYQQLLSDGENKPPFAVSYSAQQAVIRALAGFVDIRREGDRALHTHEVYRLQTDLFWIELQQTGHLLGNENHFILLIENLIHNALYYCQAKSRKNRRPRIAIKLTTSSSDLHLTIYNTGPTIQESDRAQIFQLGYSTKRSREHRGKGLGLYFVQQIVKGYEGAIDFENIGNQAETYVIRLEFADGTKQSEIIHTVVSDTGQPLCRYHPSKESKPQAEFRFNTPLTSAEIATQSTQKTVNFLPASAEEKHGEHGEHKKSGGNQFIDPNHPDQPQWCIEYAPGKSRHKLIFRPLDISGVRFSVTLPSAESRLDADYHEVENETLQTPQQLSEDHKRFTN